MKKRIQRSICFSMAALMTVGICGCGSNMAGADSVLNPDEPVTVTVWNYYNGDQLTAFDHLVDEFNSSVGTEKGIVVVSVSQGDIGTLADLLLASADGKAGAEECPTMASVYSETAFILDQSDMLVNLDDYFTEDELAAYIPEFIEEGRFNENDDLLLFPISKSTEVFTANETDWAAFADATGITLENIKTQEDLVAAAEEYYNWTDALTPDVPEDGKALYGRDSVANYIYVGSYELGHEMFSVDNGKVSVDLDRDTFKTLWDNYYIPYINGYFGSYANFRSEDAKTGKILALTSSTSSMGYLPSQVTLEDDSTHDITMYVAKSLPFASAKNNAVVQQGASFCVLKSTEVQQQGAVEFLKWFTETDRNMDFSLMSGYSPVTIEANNADAITKACAESTENPVDQITLDSLLISADEFGSNNAYASKPFSGSKNIRSILDGALQDTAAADRAVVEENIASGMSHEDAVAQFETEEYFDEWFTELVQQVNDAVE